MKKLTTLVLAAGLVVSSFAGTASAAEFRPFAQFAEEFTFGDEGKTYGFNGDLLNPALSSKSAENFNAATRIRFGFDYVASEDLSATMLFQYGAHSWGNSDNTPDYNFTKDPSANLQMRLAYIDWTLPTTDVKVRMGRQAVVAPSYAFGSAILDGRADAVSLTGNVNENISLGLTWAKVFSADGGFRAEDDANAVMLTSEFNYDGVKVAPWAMYINKQDNANVGFYPNIMLTNGISADAYVLGASAELSMFDPFVFAVDALYSRINSFIPTLQDDDCSAFYIGASAKYKLANGTVALKGWYASGSEIKADGSFDIKAFSLLDGGFSATTILFGDNIIGADEFNTLTGDSPFGTLGVVAEYAGFSFMDKLTHTARVAYVTGTNDMPVSLGKVTSERFITDNDTFIEVDFNSTYEIYKNLSATLELGYVFVDQDKVIVDNFEKDDIFRSALTFVYNF